MTTSGLQMLSENDGNSLDQSPFDNLCYLLLSPDDVPRTQPPTPLGRQVASSVWDALDQFQLS
jgi:hypothetical protein